MRLLLLLFFSIELMAMSIDPLLLKAQASIFPKIMLLDTDISKKTHDKKLLFSIIHTDNERSSAMTLKKMIEAEYKDKLGELHLEIRLDDIKEFTSANDAGAYYVFDASSPKMKKVISHAEKTHRICFGYNYKDFDQNILISLFVKEKTYIYLNKSALHEYGIKFMPIFYRIAKVVE